MVIGNLCHSGENRNHVCIFHKKNTGGVPVRVRDRNDIKEIRINFCTFYQGENISALLKTCPIENLYKMEKN